MARFGGKTAVVTGAARGIGRAIAERLLAESAEVLFIDKEPFELSLSDPDEALRAKSLAIDLTSPNAAQGVRAALGGKRIDFLVNNAGIGGAKSLSDTTDEDWNRFLQTNLTSVFRLCRDLLPDITEPGGRIVNLSSVFALTGFPESLAYSVAKAGIAQFTRQVATDLAPRGILVNGIAPGVIETEMTRRRIENDPWYQKVQCDTTPLGRNGQPEDIAGVAAFLCSDDASFMTGQVLVVDGGWLESKYLPPL